VPGAEPIRPKPGLVLVLALIGGLALAIAVSMFAETIDERASRVDQLQEITGLPTLASFPLRPRLSARRRTLIAPGAPRLTAVGANDEGAGAADGSRDPSDGPKSLLPTRLQDSRDLLTTNEAVGLLRTIESVLRHVPTPIIQFSTAYDGEGASTVSYAVADVAARTFGKRVLLIHAGSNPEWSSPQSPIFSLEEVAYGNVSFDSVVAGPQVSSINVASLGLSDARDHPPRMRELIGVLFNRLRDRFDLVIMDAPAILTNFQTAALSEFTDGTVLVVEAERTRGPVARRAIQLVEANGGRVLGAVLNKRRMHIPGWAYGRR
jgi:protein-tyrosine kinase